MSRRSEPEPYVMSDILVDILLSMPKTDWSGVKIWKSCELDDGLRLVVKRALVRSPRKYMYLWYVLRGQEVVAAGDASSDPEATRRSVALGTSAVVPSMRSKGLYTSVLRALRKLVGSPIESDTMMSPGAIGAWKKAGGKMRYRGEAPVYRINPTRANPSVQWIEQYHHGEDIEPPYSSLLWVDPVHSRRGGVTSSFRWGHHEGHSLSFKHSYPIAFRYASGPMVLSDSKRWMPSERDEWHASVIKGTIVGRDVRLDDASLRRLGMARYMEGLPELIAMADRLRELDHTR